MKHILVLAAVLFSSQSAFATKARVNALQHADFWVDTQNIFNYPQYVSQLGQYATFEFGATGSGATNPKAEGGFVKKVNDGFWGGYLGHADEMTATLRTAASVADQQNPLYFFYASGDTGYGLQLSYSNVKSTSSKDLTAGFTYGTKFGDWDFGANVIAYSNGETSGVTVKELPHATLSANTNMGTWKVYSSVMTTFAKVSDVKTNNYAIQLGAQDHGMKISDTGTFFYGAEINASFGDIATITQLPVFVGLETELVNWLVLRGSVSQNVLLGSVKPKGSTTDINVNDTSVAFGTGFKYNKFQLDGLIAAGTSGNLNGSTFMTNAALSYFF